MKLLLDTHIALWAASDDAKLSRNARAMITDPDNTISVSVVSLWEIAIKQSIRGGRAVKDPLPLTLHDASEAFSESGFEVLDLTPDHVRALATLPLHHGDPFDRILIAQARAESLSLLTSDRKLPAYGTGVIAV